MKFPILLFTTCLIATMALMSGCEPGQSAKRDKTNKREIAAKSLDDTKSPATPDPAKQLLGVWRIDRVGEKRLDDTGVEVFWTFSKDEYVVTDGFGNEFSRTRYEIDTTQTPHHITTTLIAITGKPPEDSETGKGIFAINGDELRVCLEFGKPTRPTGFEGNLVVHLVRVLGPDL